MNQIRTILVATDFSEHSDQAIDAAVLMAKTFGAKLHLIHAFDVPIPLVSPYEVALPDGFIEEAREAARARLREAEEKVRAAGVEVKAHLGEVPAAPAITATAEQIGADLIVMGTRGNTGLKHVLLGSVAERTLRSAPCAVLTVKSNA